MTVPKTCGECEHCDEGGLSVARLDEPADCRHPDAPEYSGIGAPVVRAEGEPPAWCPLRQPAAELIPEEPADKEAFKRALLEKIRRAFREYGAADGHLTVANVQAERDQLLELLRAGVPLPVGPYPELTGEPEADLRALLDSGRLPERISVEERDGKVVETHHFASEVVRTFGGKIRFKL